MATRNIVEPRNERRLGHTPLRVVTPAGYSSRVCRAWHVACGVEVPAPGIGEAEGKLKGNCVTARWGGKEAQGKSTRVNKVVFMSRTAYSWTAPEANFACHPAVVGGRNSMKTSRFGFSGGTRDSCINTWLTAAARPAPRGRTIPLFQMTPGTRSIGFPRSLHIMSWTINVWRAHDGTSSLSLPFRRPAHSHTMVNHARLV